MASREDWRRFAALQIDFSAIQLEPQDQEHYFCTPEGAEIIGWCNGIHFILLPGDEAVYCVSPEMGEEDTFVLPVAGDFREFLSFLLYCRGASALEQIAWFSREQIEDLLREDRACEAKGELPEYYGAQRQALRTIEEAFSLGPREPYERVRALQKAFDPSVLTFSDEYYEVLGLENPRKTEEKKSGEEPAAFCMEASFPEKKPE